MSEQSPAADLVAALAAMREVEKKGKADVGGRRTYRYMELPDLLAAVRATLAAHNLAVMQELHAVDRDVTVVTVLMHTTGERFTSPPLTIRTGGTAQDIGSAATYARRYSLAAFVGLAGSDDDDGAAAQRTPPEPPPAVSPPPRPAAPSRMKPDMKLDMKLDDLITDPQLRKMHALFGEIDDAYGHHTDTDARRQVAATYANRDPNTLESMRDLTMTDARKVIDALQHRLVMIRQGEQSQIGDPP